MDHYFFNNKDQSFVIDNQSFTFDETGWHRMEYQFDKPNDTILTKNSADDLERSLRKISLWSNGTFNQLRHNLKHFIIWCVKIMSNPIIETTFSIQAISDPDFGLEIGYDGQLNEAKPQLEFLTGGPGQKFIWTGKGNIMCVHSKLFLTLDKDAITQEEFRNNSSQLFQITSDNEISCHSYVFDISQNIIKPNTPIIPWAKNNGINQKWFLRYSNFQL